MTSSSSNSSTPFFISGLSSLAVRHTVFTVGAGNVSNQPSFLLPSDVTTSAVNSRRLDFPHIDPARSVAIAFPLILIVLCTVCGNLLVLLAVITTRKLRTATNYFIVNLAIADMMLGLTVLPFSSTIEILNEFWIFGQVVCDFWVTIDVLCCTASIYSLCVISIDRYIGVSKPLAHHQIVNKRRAIFINIGVWLLSAAICVVPFFGWRKSLSVEASGRCEVNEDRAYVIFSATCSFFLPCAVVILVYWRIYLKAVQQTRFMKLGYKEAKMTSKGEKGENGVMLRIHTGAVISASCSLAPRPSNAHLQVRQSVGKRDSAISTELAQLVQIADTNLRQRKIDWTKFKRERRAARTLGIVVGVFIACWFPFFVILPVNAFCECLPQQLFKVVFWLGYCNSLMNPFIYGADSRDFQMAFKRLLCDKKTPAYSSTTSTPHCPSSLLAKTRRQLLMTRNRAIPGVMVDSNNNNNNPPQYIANNGAVDNYLRPAVHTQTIGETESCNESADGLSTSVVMKLTKSNSSLNGIAANNGQLAPPSAASEPLLTGDFADQNCQETTLNDNATSVVPSPEGDSGATSKGVESQSPSHRTAKAPVQVPALDLESSPQGRDKRSGSDSHKNRLPSVGKKLLAKQENVEQGSPISSKEPTPSPRQFRHHERIQSTSSLSSLSSPSDSDDEELKQRKRERRPKKHFSQ